MDWALLRRLTPAGPPWQLPRLFPPVGSGFLGSDENAAGGMRLPWPKPKMPSKTLSRM